MYDLDRTLFVSDLDGTLLKSDGTLSKETVRKVGELIRRGVKFTFATARSYYTAMQAAGELPIRFPIILHNGVFIRDTENGAYIKKNLLPNPEYIRKAFDECGLSPFVYSAEGDRQVYSYIKEKIPPESAAYQLKRAGDPRDNPISDEARLWDGDVFYVLCITNDPKAEVIYRRLCNDYNCLYGEDYYSRDKWLEVYAKGASKAEAALQLRDILGCNRLVVFGDGANDISMFEAADEAYAVSGAVDELKAHATEVIGSNDEDAVVDWLLFHTVQNNKKLSAKR